MSSCAVFHHKIDGIAEGVSPECEHSEKQTTVTIWRMWGYGAGAFIGWAVRSLQYKKYDTRVTLIQKELKQLIMDATLCEKCVYCLY